MCRIYVYFIFNWLKYCCALQVCPVKCFSYLISALYKKNLWISAILYKELISSCFTLIHVHLESSYFFMENVENRRTGGFIKVTRESVCIFRFARNINTFCNEREQLLKCENLKLICWLLCIIGGMFLNNTKILYQVLSSVDHLKLSTTTYAFSFFILVNVGTFFAVSGNPNTMLVKY